MVRFSHYPDAPYPVEKITRLYTLLNNLFKDNEALINSIENIKVRDLISRLAGTCNQFASELHLKVRALAEISETTFEVNEPGIYRGVDCRSGDLDVLISTEKLIINGYRDVLNEPFTDVKLRQRLNYQLSETLFLFMRLKLMNSLKVKMYYIM